MKIPVIGIKKLGFELLVVFIGMTSAIGLDNYNENVNASKEEREILEFMIQDIENDIKLITNIKEYDIKREEGQLGSTMDFSANRFGYITLLNYQKAEKIKNKQLMQEIFSYYRLCDQAEKTENDFQLLEKEITTFLIESDYDWLNMVFMTGPNTQPKLYVKATKNHLKNRAISQYFDLHLKLLMLKNHNNRMIAMEANNLLGNIHEYLKN